MQVIWNSKMRDEVLAQMELERMEGSAVATADQDTQAEPGSPTTAGAPNAPATGFRFAALGKELVVAGVFVGVYNQQPNFAVADPAAFCRGLVTFIHSRMKPEIYYVGLPSPQQGPGHSTGTTSGSQSTSSRGSTPLSPSIDPSHAFADGQAPLIGRLDTAGQSQQAERDTAGQSQQAERDNGQQISRQEVVQALQALINILQAVPKLTALMASRPAITPLLNCLDPICRLGACWMVDVVLGLHACTWACTHSCAYAPVYAYSQTHFLRMHKYACMRVCNYTTVPLDIHVLACVQTHMYTPSNSIQC